jgi:hypothetical protein
MKCTKRSNLNCQIHKGLNYSRSITIAWGFAKVTKIMKVLLMLMHISCLK